MHSIICVHKFAQTSCSWCGLHSSPALWPHKYSCYVSCRGWYWSLENEHTETNSRTCMIRRQNLNHKCGTNVLILYTYVWKCMLHRARSYVLQCPVSCALTVITSSLRRHCLRVPPLSWMKGILLYYCQTKVCYHSLYNLSLILLWYFLVWGKSNRFC